MNIFVTYKAHNIMTKTKQIIILEIIIIVFLALLSSPLKAQTDISDNSNNKVSKKNWAITVNGGATLMWSDYTEEYPNPFEKYFTDQQGWAGGFILKRELGKIVSVNFQYLGGFFQGNKTFTTDSTSNTSSFNSNFHNVNLNLELDILNIFKKKEKRYFAPYIKAGIGYIYSNSTVNNTPDLKNSTIEIPWGFGIRSDLSPRWSLRFENTIHSALGDAVDGHNPENSEANDIYIYTSVGVSYHFGRRIREPKLNEEDIIETKDSVIAKTQPVFNLNIASNLPSSMKTSDTVDVVIRINKGNLKGEAKLQQTFTNGFSIISKEVSGAKYSYENNILTYKWAELPSDQYVSISYTLITNNIEKKTQNISGMMFYMQNDTNQIRQFSKQIEITSIPEEVVASNTPSEENTIEENTIEENTNTKPKGRVIYRVQVYTVIGGTTSTKLLQKRLRLPHTVTQDYDGKYAKYTSGEFATYEEAAAYKKQLRNSSVPGAFVVGFYEGQRTKTIGEAIAIEKGQEPLNNTVAKGLVYRIQIMAASKNLSSSEVREITGATQPFIKVSHNNLYKYEIGNYKSYSEAKIALKKVRVNVKDAFLVKYIDGVRK